MTVTALIQLVLPIVLAALVALMRPLVADLVTTYIHERERRIIGTAARVAARAVWHDQMHIDAFIAQACTVAERYLARYGVALDLDELVSYLKSALHEIEHPKAQA